MSRNNDTQKYVRNSNFIQRKIGTDCILIPVRQKNTETESLYTLNSVASFIWEYLERPKSIDELAEALQNEFEVSKDIALQDVTELLANLGKGGLVFNE